jgi:ABC-type polysaccharide/polyol phosphate export permease
MTTTEVPPEVRELLICPVCAGPLDINDRAAACGSCGFVRPQQDPGFEMRVAGGEPAENSRTDHGQVEDSVGTDAASVSPGAVIPMAPVTSSAHRPRPFPVGGLLWTLVRTDFKTRYHGTIGGFAWALLKPLTMFVVLMGVFSYMFASSPVYKVNLLVGLFLFNFFSESTTVGITSMLTRGYLLNKAKFPSWIVVVSSASNALVTLGIFTVFVFVVLAATSTFPTPAGILLFFTYVLALVVMTIGISLGGSVLFLKYRDLNQVWEVVLQAGFFVAPVVYPLSIIPERFHFYLYLWPPTSVIQFSRAVLIDHTIPTFRAHLLLLGMTTVIFLGGLGLFRRYGAGAPEHL